MSNYGVVIKNSNNETIIDGVNDNYMLWFTLTVSNTFVPIFDRYGSYGDPFTALMPACFSKFPETVTTQEPPIVCGYSLYGAAVFGYCTGEPGKWDGFVWFGGWEVGVNMPDFGGAKTVNASMRLAIFSRYGAPQKRGNYGIQIIKDGNTVYDSRALPFIPVGDVQYKRYGGADGRTLARQDGEYAYNLPPKSACVVDTISRTGAWPLLSSLTQRVICGLDGFEFTGFSAAPIMALSVSNDNYTFTYKFVAIVHGIHSFGKRSSGNLWFGVGGSGRDTQQLYNTGGGQGAYNLIAFAKMPAQFQ